MSYGINVMLVFLTLISFSNSPITGRISIEEMQRSFESLITNQNLNHFNFEASEYELESIYKNSINLILRNMRPNELFSHMNKRHQLSFKELTEILMSKDSIESFLETALFLRNNHKINKSAWLSSILFIKSRLPYLKDVNLRYSFPELMPQIMFNYEDLENAIKSAESYNQDTCFPADETIGDENGIENKIWYFRQDFFANSHHHFWHLLFLQSEKGKMNRHGETFYFMHHEFLARYTAERMNQGLPPLSSLKMRVGSLVNRYNSHLTGENSGIRFKPRNHNVHLSDILTPSGNVTLAKMEEMENRIYDSVQAGYLIHSNGSKIDILNIEGIDILANVIESAYSINPKYYGEGGFHNDGHSILAMVMSPVINDVDNVEQGIISVASTSFRDPVFYRFHQTIEKMFIFHKDFFEPYSPKELELPLLWDEVEIQQLEVYQNIKNKTNVLETFWSKKEFNIPSGLDWFRNLSLPHIKVCTKHLNHHEFHFKIILNNTQLNPISATVRIFIAPKFTQNGERIRVEEQRKLFFTLDRFKVDLIPGESMVQRSSKDSSLTIPYSTWIENVTESYCGCGWPNHLLLPKGTSSGAVFDLFVMLTDYEEDKVEDDLENNNVINADCKSSSIWCTEFGKKYPDKRPMGYPFDRRPYSLNNSTVEYIEDYVQGIPNMKTVEVTIVHRED